MAKRNTETASENLAAWGRANLALGGYAPRQWVDRALREEVAIDAVPEQYRPMVRTYLEIAAARKAG